MSRFYSFYELLNFWTLNYELGDDLHKTRWQGANIKATHSPSACVHLYSLNLSVWLFLFTMCVCVQMRVCNLCVFVWETERRGCTCDRVHGWLVVRIYIFGVHNSLTVLPSEIPGSGCVTQTHTHTNRSAHIHTTSIQFNTIGFLVLYEWHVQKVDCPAQEGETDREREWFLWASEHNHCYILYCKTTTTHLAIV